MNLHNLTWVFIVPNIATLLREQEKHKEAIKFYNQAIKINPNEIEYHMEKGNSNDKLQDFAYKY